MTTLDLTQAARLFYGDLRTFPAPRGEGLPIQRGHAMGFHSLYLWRRGRAAWIPVGHEDGPWRGHGQCPAVRHGSQAAGIRRRRPAATVATSTRVAKSGIRILPPISPPCSANFAARVWSVHAKSAGARYVFVGTDNSGGFQAGVYFDLIAGTVAATSQHPTPVTGLSGQIAALPNGWYRCTTSATSYNSMSGLRICPAISFGFLYNRQVTGTDAWPLGAIEIDAILTAPGGEKVATPTVTLIVIQGPTDV